MGKYVVKKANTKMMPAGEIRRIGKESITMQQKVKQIVVHLLLVLIFMSIAWTGLTTFGAFAPLEVNAETTTGILVLADSYSNDYLAFRKNGGNTWEGSDAQLWCVDFFEGRAYMDYKSLNSVARKKIVGVKTNEGNGQYTEEGITYYRGCDIDGTRTGSDASKDKVFFLSGKEFWTYNGNRADDEGNIFYNDQWWLRSPSVSNVNLVGAVGDFGTLSDYANKAVSRAHPALYLDSSLFTQKDDIGWNLDGIGTSSTDVVIAGDKVTFAGLTWTVLNAEPTEAVPYDGTDDYDWSINYGKAEDSAWLWPDSTQTLSCWVDIVNNPDVEMEFQWLSGNTSLTEWTAITDYDDDGAGRRSTDIMYKVSEAGVYTVAVREKGNSNRSKRVVYNVYDDTIIDNVIYEPLYTDDLKAQAYAIGDYGCKGDIKIASEVTLADGKTYSVYVILAVAPESTSIAVPENVVELQCAGYKEWHYDDDWSGYVGENPIPDFVIYGKAGSEAERYALYHGFTFMEAPVACKHEWNSVYTVDKEATCTKEGSESIHCSVCDAVKEGSARAIPAIGHSFSDWEITKEATEVAPGVQTRVCSRCGEKETQDIAQLKPTLKAVTILKPKAAKKSATIKWKKVTKKNLKKTKKIEIQYSTDKNFKKNVKSKYASAKKTSYKIKKLKSKKKYYVRIRAYTKSGGQVHVSKWSAKKPFKVK